MALSEQGREVWASEQGQSLMKAMLSGKPVDKDLHEETLAQLRQKPQASDQPNKAEHRQAGTESLAMDRRGHDRRVMRSGEQVILDGIYDALARKGVPETVIERVQI